MGARDIDVLAMLENWARWCRRVAECYPDGYACMSAEGQLWIPYRNGDQSADEKLEALAEHQEPDELSAARVERIVVGLGRPLDVAIRVEYVWMPESRRVRRASTSDQWNERRARLATRRARWYFSPQMYRDAVSRAIDEIEAAL